MDVLHEIKHTSQNQAHFISELKMYFMGARETWDGKCTHTVEPNLIYFLPLHVICVSKFHVYVFKTILIQLFKFVLL